MKTLYFDKLIMLSPSEKSARSVEFDQKTTIIKGKNDTGKSSLIKTIYSTLGATPPDIHERWQALDVISCLEFRVDGTRYSMLKNRKTYTLFNERQEVIKTFRSVTGELAPYFAELFQFRLTLQARDDLESQAPPAFLFLPFYIDQDKSWTNTWAGFDKLTQFRSFRRDLVEYHIGLKPNEYYDLKVKLAEKKLRKNEAIDSLEVLELAVEKIDNLTEFRAKDPDVLTYYDELLLLLRHCTELQLEKEELREELASLYSRKLALVDQLRILTKSIEELDKDFLFLTDKLGDEIECPTCGTVHYNSIKERFAIAADEDECRRMFKDLKELDLKLDKEIQEIRLKFSTNNEDVKKIETLLDSAHGDIRLRDVVLSEGRKEVKGTIRADMKNVETTVGGLEIEIKQLEKYKRSFMRGEHLQVIKGRYSTFMERFCGDLAVVNLGPRTFSDPATGIRESGSVKPRALLAYYFTILNLISEFGASTFCPIVIDSPKQQDQDDDNWERIVEFIFERSPKGSQIILGLVDEGEVDLRGTKVIELDSPYGVLQKSAYESVAAEIRPLIDRSLADDTPGQGYFF